MGPEVLGDLNFSVEPQSFQFLTGPSGAGKTTLMRLMLLSLRPTRGTIRVFGQDSAALTKDDLTTLRRRIGAVFQDPTSYLNPNLTIGSQLTEVLRVKTGLSRRQARQRAAQQIISSMGL